ncbi:MAG TPA: hypothetical protein VGF69_14895 [Thermoanaerobaculia bacterium]|jgi:hypothetical protein
MTVRSILLITTFVLSASVAAAQPCTLTESSDLFAPYASPESAGRAQWKASYRVAYKLMRECPDGPADVESRRLFFRYVDQQFSLDYARLQKVWAQQGEPLSEAGMETVRYFRQDLRTYLDRIVDPARDAASAPVLLRHAGGAAIAKLGPAVKGDVIAMAKSNRPSKFWAERDDQIVAIQAIGEWLASMEIDTAAERELTSVLVATLPSPDHVKEGRTQALTLATLHALGQTNDAETQRQLIAWANQYARAYGTSNDIATAARDSVNAISRRLAQP